MTRRSIRHLAICLASALTACGDPTATTLMPAIPVRLAIEELRGPLRTTNDAGEPVVTCEVVLRANIGGGGAARWLGATFRIYAGTDRSTSVGEATFSAEELSQVWGAGEIRAGEPQLSHWIATLGVPFTATMEFRYRATPGGREGSATTGFSCGPDGSPNAAPPEITALDVVPSTGELPAGSSLTVTYSAAAPAGLWNTGVIVAGPCEVRQSFAEDAPPTVTRTVVVRLPPECGLGQPIVVGVEAIDVLARRVVRSHTTEVTLYDREPPTIAPIYFTPFGEPSSTFRGDYFGGDTVRVSFGALDNHALRHLVWEVLPFGARDSLAVSSHSEPGLALVPLRPEWSGDLQLRLYARDAVGLLSPTVTTSSSTAHVYPTVARPTTTATIAGETRAMAIDGRRNVVYLAQDIDRRVAIFSIATNAVTATVALPASPTDLDLTAGGDSLLVVLDGRPELAVVDLRQQPTPTAALLPVPGLDASVAQAPVGVRVGSNGRAYVTLGGSAASARRMIELNLATGTTRPLPAAGGGAGTGVGFLEVSHDRSVIVVSSDSPWCTQRYDVAADAFSACVQPSAPGWPASVDATGARFAVGYDLYDESMQLLPKTEQLQGGVFGALSLDGQSLYLVIWTSIVRRATDMRILDRTLNPVQANLARFSPDGSWLVTVERPLPWEVGTKSSTGISIIDMR